jgi:glutathione S-transferase
VTIRLYGIPLSHPALAARGMLDRKGVDYTYTDLIGGSHPVQLRALGFRGVTVPALRLSDGRRVQGSLAIAEALEQLAPLPALHPAGRPEVREAEQWGERVLQPVPRRLIRWGLAARLSQRQWFADVASPFGAPRLMGVLLTPIVPLFVRQVGATDARVRADLAELPGLLDHVDQLLADGVIGGEDLNAADFQIGASVRMLAAFADAGRAVADRPSDAFGRRIVPDYPAIPAALPPDWLP